MDYRSTTLCGRTDRLAFLPCFPSSINQNDEQQQEDNLLLANVSSSQLSVTQLKRRQQGQFKRLFTYHEKKDRTSIPSMMKYIYRTFLFNLSQRLKVDESILDFNLNRLNEITREIVRQRGSNKIQAYHIQEWPIALEIFLQIDVDSCFMKTCSYRGSHPRLINENDPNSIEGLFCGIDPPDTRYLMLPCTNSDCSCCYQSSTRLALEQSHRFVNGYQIYLNCHATCQTKNFLYALTCPCGQFDFIGSSHETNQSFKDVLLVHRRTSVRILHEFLLGEHIIQRTRDMYEREKHIDEEQADQQRLYQHLTQCSAALQLLLNRSAYYWSFIPMESVDADQEDEQFSIHRNDSMLDQDWSPCERTDDEVDWCLSHLPQTPYGTRFSSRQRQHQTMFFKHGWDLLFLPPRHLDLFTMTPIFLLPDPCSSLLCQVIESLLITHAECQLNTQHSIESICKQPTWYQNLTGRHYK